MTPDNYPQSAVLKARLCPYCASGNMGLGWGDGGGEGRWTDFGGPACLNEAVAEESERRYRRLVFVSEL